MKHPILYRIGMYSCLVLLIASVLFLMNLMNGAPFKSSDMRDAYLSGCNFGARPLTDANIAECVNTSDMFKDTLDDLDRQMEIIDARRKQNE